MTLTLTPISTPDAAGLAKPLVSYNDGTNNAVAHVLLDGTGALISPATSGKQDTANTALAAIQASVGNIPAAPATAANQATANSSLATIATNTTGASTAVNQATANTALSAIQTAVTGATPAGTNIIGKVGIDQTTPGTTNGVQVNAALPAGANTIGSVSAASNTSGGASTYAALGGTGNALLAATPVAVKSSAGNLYGIDFVNTGASAAYVQFFDVAAGSVTLGTTVPKMAKWVPAGGAWEEKLTGEAKVSFATAITVAATTTPTGSSAPSPGILANIVYK